MNKNFPNELALYEEKMRTFFTWILTNYRSSFQEYTNGFLPDNPFLPHCSAVLSRNYTLENMEKVLEHLKNSKYKLRIEIHELECVED